MSGKGPKTAPARRMPVVFVGHGSPMNAVQRNEFRRGWEDLGRRLPRPAAILCVSAHWEAPGVRLTAAERPETLHDFHGFPPALFEVRYPAPGDPLLARRAAGVLAGAGARLDPARGLDHGAWSVLVAMYPAADVPVVELSMDTGRPGAFHYGLAGRLAPLRDEGVLILGSGNIVHNLRLFDPDEPEPPEWAARWDETIKKRIAAGDHEALASPGALGPDARLAVPTPEHYLPLLYVLALRNAGEPAAFFNSKVLSTISMTSVLIGEVP
jgi:4,5-DOPA dioxygenase extradiol